MSLDLYVFYDRHIDTIYEWQKGLDILEFPLVLATDRRLNMLKGHLPAWWNGREAGFECRLIDVRDLSRTYEDVDFGGSWRYAMAFNWGTFQGCAGAVMAAAALAHVTAGTVFDPQEGAVLSPAAGVAYARETVASIPGLEVRFKGMNI